ncbi:APC family permease [Desulfotruncus alcoholivorax]|uniref:APC family permease n=1 Tax=Desulfotruncus alcoholivorax TaxID=265477 RepID=UPI00040986FC|nr:APC family permease [Desulfotruncus alcoholivorax]
MSIMEQPANPGLKKHYMKTTTVAFMIYSMVCAGAYGIEDMIPVAGPGLTMVMLLILPFIWGTPQSLVNAELGSAIPEEGGYYKWVQRALGEFWAFQAGWWRTISIYFDNTLYVVLAGAYLATAAHLSDTEAYIFKAAVIIFFTYINIRGIKDVGAVSTIISILVIVAFGIVTVIGLLHWHANPFVPFIPEGQSLFESIGYGLAIGMWMYSGYESMSTLAGEVKNPQVIPKALLITAPIIIATYILPTMAGIASVGRWDSWATEGGITYSDVATSAGYHGLGLFFVAVAVIAQFSIYNAYIASGSRVFFSLAEDNLAPKFFTKCSKKRGVPYVTVLSMGIFSLLISPFSFDVIVVVDVMLLMASYVLIFISGIVLRIKEGDMPRPFKVPVGTKVFAAMCIPPILIAFIALFINGTDYFLGGMVGIISGPVMYFVFKRLYGGMAKIDSVKYPLNPKTGLGFGDVRRMAWMFAGLTVTGLIALGFLPWYEDPAYYTDYYGVEGLFEAMMRWIEYITVGSGIVAVLLAVIARRVDPAGRIGPKEVNQPVSIIVEE